jgi:L-asparagine transporter-like permease
MGEKKTITARERLYALLVCSAVFTVSMPLNYWLWNIDPPLWVAGAHILGIVLNTIVTAFSLYAVFALIFGVFND